MQMSQTGVALLKHFEGLELEAYQDSVGVWTIGYGHTKHAIKGMVITEEDCGTEECLQVRSVIEGGDVVVTLKERILGRVLAKDVLDNVKSVIGI